MFVSLLRISFCVLAYCCEHFFGCLILFLVYFTLCWCLGYWFGGAFVLVFAVLCFVMLWCCGFDFEFFEF